MSIGIIGYGVYLPYYRIKFVDIATAWNLEMKVPGEKTVPSHDETTFSLAYNAVMNAMNHANINPEEIGAVFFCSTTGMIESSQAQDIAVGISTKDNITLADLHASPRSFTTALILCIDGIKSGRIKYGLIIGSDILVGGPGSAITSAASEYVSAAGAGAMIIGENGAIADIEGMKSINTPVKPQWRDQMDRYPHLGDGRFIRDYGYIANVSKAGLQLMQDMNRKEYTHILLQQPHAQWVQRTLAKFGIPKQDLMKKLMAPGSIIGKFGDIGCACLPVGMAEILDNAKPNDTILAISYGSGGSDSFSIIVNDKIDSKRDKIFPVKSFSNKKEYVNYTTYLRYNKILERYTE